MTPILFVVGPSGVGKSYLAKELKRTGFLHVHIDTDRKERSFAANGFPVAWDEDFRGVDLPYLVAVFRNRPNKEHAGVVVSFPTVHVFTPGMLVEASRLGVTPVLLWGTRDKCLKAAQARIEKKGIPFNPTRYHRLNDPTFRAYCGAEYDAFRVEAFRADGSRVPAKEWVAAIVARLAG